MVSWHHDLSMINKRLNESFTTTDFDIPTIGQSNGLADRVRTKGNSKWMCVKF